ncbi:zinc finger protein 585B-like [Cherax quadricarinatus]|uniref:zinc finger protein 585B-like n=1 Tax=Cherax quadricarinatus TaxID=27406 RepID=UPI00387E6167
MKAGKDSKTVQVLVPNTEEVSPVKDILHITTTNMTVTASTAIELKQKENGDLVKSKLTESIMIKVKDNEASKNVEANTDKCALTELDKELSVLEGKNTDIILHNTRRSKTEQIRIKTNSKKIAKYKCKFCGISLQTTSTLRSHVMTHTGEKPHSCPYCSMTFRQSHHLTEHERTHTGERPFECELCEDTFTTMSALKLHVKVHNGIKNHKCHICYVAFSSGGQLRIHLLKHEDKIYECSECGDKFITEPRLKRHLRIHTGERPFQCEECGVSFREETTLRAHMGTHLSRGPYPCELCEKVFSRLSSLSLHKKVHNTNGTYRYVSQKIPAQDNDNYINKTLNENICLKNNVSEKSESRSKSISTKEKNFRNSTTVLSSDTFSSIQNMQSQDLDSDFISNIQPSATITGNATTEVEQMTNIPHPDIVRDALATGTVLESQGEDGQGYLIVLPKALAEKDYTLITFPPLPKPRSPPISETVVLQETEEIGHSNCDLLVWDNGLDSVTEVTFEPEKELFPAEEMDNKTKKQKRQKISKDEEMIIHDLHTNKSIKFKRKEKKILDKKIRIPRSYECEQCGKDCKTSSNYIIHMRTHTGERPYYCDYCGIGFKQIAHLKAHVRIHTGEEPYRCNLCDAAFKQSSRLRCHQRTQHIEGKVKKMKIAKKCFVRNFYCKICDKTFLDSCYKKQHMQTHADETRYKCNKCDAIFKTKSSLRKHSKLHVDDNGGICEMCGLQLKSVKALNLHKQTSHNIDIDDLNKDVSHLLVGIKDEVEDDAPSSDDNKEGIIKTASVSENGQYKHKCSLEVDSGCAENTLKTKSSITAVLKQYQCTVCKKNFKQSSNLKTHMRMHTDERPYRCNDCGSAFRQISHLKDHVKMHTGEKPFRCSSCSAAFTQSSAVKYHIKKYHQGMAHVMKEQKNKHLLDKEFILLEKIGNLNEDPVVVSIDNGNTVLVESKTFENDIEIFKDKKKEHCVKCGKYIHENEEQKNICKCSVYGKPSKVLTPSVKCEEELSEEYIEICIDHYKQKETHFKNDSLETVIKRNTEEKVEIFKGISKVCNSSECEEPCKKYDKKDKRAKENSCNGNTCTACGIVFRRASALRFHKQMSHKNSFDEEPGLVLNCNSENVDFGKNNRVKHSSKLIKKMLVKQSQYQPINFPFKTEGEKEDHNICKIEYCKCSFCGEKFSDLSKLNEHVNKLHPEKIFTEELQATDNSNINPTLTRSASDNYKVNSWTRKIKRENEGSAVANVVNSNNVREREIYLKENSQYKCQGCGKSFTRLAKLKDHINSWCKKKLH